jgi:hypothetical protein
MQTRMKCKIKLILLLEKVNNSLKNIIFRLSSPYFMGLIVGFIVVVFPTVGYNLNHFPGDLGDGRFNMYILEHAWKFISFQNVDFWNAPFFYPAPEVISFSDNLLGTAPIYGLCKIFGARPEQTFVYYYLVLQILNYSSAYFVLKKLYKDRWTAMIGAFIFAFSIALVSQEAHAQTFARFPIPFIVYFLLKFNHSFQWKHFAFATFWLVYLMYCGIYLGMMMMVLFGLIGLFILLFNFKNFIESLTKKWNLFWLLLNGFVSFFSLSWLFQPYIKRAALKIPDPYELHFFTIPHPKSYLYSHKDSFLWKGLSTTANDFKFPWDHQLFFGIIGIVALVMAVYFLIFKYKKQSKEFKILVLSTVLLFALYLRIGNFSLYQYLYEIPGFSAMRSMTRIINIQIFLIAFFVSFLFFYLKENFKISTYKLGVLALFIVTLDNLQLEGHTKTSLAESYARRAKIDRVLKIYDTTKILSYQPIPLDDPGFVYQIDAMLSSQEFGFKCINGYSGNSPVNFTPFWDKPNDENRRHYLKDKHIDTTLLLIVH